MVIYVCVIAVVWGVILSQFTSFTSFVELIAKLFGFVTGAAKNAFKSDGNIMKRATEAYQAAMETL